ncbi:MAG: high-potential iron-sulfur protein [Candidatus Thorarchaeota archaeon]|jgi:hypothetical protein
MSKFKYEKAKKNAPPGTKESIDRFDQMSDEYKEKTPLLYHVLGESTPAYKMSQADSDYVKTSKVPSQNCENCIFTYHQPKRDVYICSQIRGKIRLSGWCRLWKG